MWKKYYQNNKDILSKKNKIYRNENQDKLNKYARDYYDDNKEEILQQKKKYYKEHKEYINNYKKEYNKLNKEKINARNKIYRNKPCNKIFFSYRRRVSELIGSGKKAPDFLGCTKEFLYHWLEFNFEIDSFLELSLDNFGKKWQLDHVIPCNIYDYKNNNELEACFNWSNLYPLVNPYNQIKGNKILFDHILRQQLRLYIFSQYNKNYKSLIITTVESCLPNDINGIKKCHGFWKVKITRIGQSAGKTYLN